MIGVVGTAANSSQLSIDRYNGHPDASHISTFERGISTATGAAGATVVSCGNDMMVAGTTGTTTCAAHLKHMGVEMVILVTTGHREGEQHDRADLGIQDTGKLKHFAYFTHFTRDLPKDGLFSQS